LSADHRAQVARAQRRQIHLEQITSMLRYVEISDEDESYS
jgi:hypothetical protein